MHALYMHLFSLPGVFAHGYHLCYAITFHFVDIVGKRLVIDSQSQVPNPEVLLIIANPEAEPHVKTRTLKITKAVKPILKTSTLSA